MGRWLAAGLALSLGVLPVGGLTVPAAMAAEGSNAQDLLDLWHLANRQREQGQLEAAQATYGKVLGIARNLNYFQEEAQTLNKIGEVHIDLGQTVEARKAFDQALIIVLNAKDRIGEGVTLNNIANAYSKAGQQEEALNIYHQALLIAQAFEDYPGEEVTLSNIANVYSMVGQQEEALNIYHQALVITRKLKDRKREGDVLNSIGLCYSELGKGEEALSTYQQALEIAREGKDRRAEGATLHNIASEHRNRSQLEVALKIYEQALDLRKEVNDRIGEGSTLNNIALVYSDLGKPEKALKAYMQALGIAKDLKNRRGEGITLNNIASVYLSRRQTEEALKTFQQALEIAKEQKDRPREGITLSNIASVYLDRGQPKEALKMGKQALKVNIEVKDRAGEGVTLNNIAVAYSGLGQQEEALKAIDQALLIAQELKDSSGKANTLSNLAFLQRDQQQPKPAIENFEKGLTIQLEIRRGLKRSDRKSFLAQSQWAAASLVELLIAQRMAAKAFTWTNLFATTDLADYSRLIEARVNNPEAQRALEGWRRRQVELQLQRQRLEQEPNERSMQQLVDQEAAQFRAAEELIGRYPEIAELLETRPADLERLQAGIPAGTVVLQPAPLTGVPKRADRMALFALTRSDLQVVTVPLSKDFTKLVETYRQQLEKGEAYLELSQQFYDLLIRPLEDRGLLPAGGRLAVIATGKLREIPLETLYDSRTKKYLLEKYPIHYLTRLSRNGAPAAQATGGPERALVLANPTPTPRELPGTEAEADYLLGTYAGSRDLRRGQATLEQFQQQASRYPILHLGTHGCFVATGCPDLGMTANTLLFANRQQYPIAEAAQLGLSNTELLVLGACQTAQITSGNDVGLSGLAYVWERAGARAVVASLWSAVDAESAQVTKAFYGNLKAGMDKAEAMRQAKLELLRRDPDGLHPYLWAPFIVIGDAAPLKGATQPGKPSP